MKYKASQTVAQKSIFIQRNKKSIDKILEEYLQIKATATKRSNCFH